MALHIGFKPRYAPLGVGEGSTKLIHSVLGRCLGFASFIQDKLYLIEPVRDYGKVLYAHDKQHELDDEDG